MRFALLALFIGTISATPRVYHQNRIVGGSVTTINNYPHIVVLLATRDLVNYYHNCGGSILNQRNILTAAHCFDWDNIASRWRIRVGSSFAHSGGNVYNVNQFIIHPNYEMRFDYDIAILRTPTFINYVDNAIQPGLYAGPNYRLDDNEVVWAAGWGVTEYGVPSEQLRHVQIWTINQSTCRNVWSIINDNMLCTGWLGTGGRDQCTGDSGGPLYHNGIIVGVCSFGHMNCGVPTHPGVNVRVSRFTTWITDNAV